jgi:hypothetical protein
MEVYFSLSVQFQPPPRKAEALREWISQMPNKHSEAAIQRRLAKRLLLRNAFQDNILRETVNLLSADQLATLMSDQLDYVLPHVLRCERGEVLLDSRGTGSFQRIGGQEY